MKTRCPHARRTMLQSGGNQNANSSVAPIGVLQCASNSCKLRVIGASTWNCCKACSASNGTAHDKECLQVPLEGYATRDDWLCSQGIAKRSFTTRLRALLEKQGPLHISELPYAWNATYGEASWVEDRPVRSASKAKLTIGWFMLWKRSSLVTCIPT